MNDDNNSEANLLSDNDDRNVIIGFVVPRKYFKRSMVVDRLGGDYLIKRNVVDSLGGDYLIGK